MAQVTADLIAHVGGDPSATQLIVIQGAAVKAVRLALLSEHLLTGDPGDGDQHHVLAWLNGLRRDMETLGLERRGVKDISASANYLADYFSRPPPKTPPVPR
jgi:hypothetical protein